MTEQDWFFLASSQEDLHGELQTVVQRRKLFLLGAACLRQAWDLLTTHFDRLAVEATERYARGQANACEMLEAWSLAEYESADHLWLRTDNWYWWCPCCAGSIEQDDIAGIHPQAHELARDHPLFAIEAARQARERLLEGTPDKKREEKEEAELRTQYALYRDIVGEPTARHRPAPPQARLPAVRQLLRALDRQRELDPLALLALADALEESGCPEEALLGHLREQGPHSPGCWALETLLGRAERELRFEDGRRG